MFFQPEFEQALDGHACQMDPVTVERGWVAEGLRDLGDGTELTIRRVTEDHPGRVVATEETRTVRARWLVGADGANSFVRETLGIARRDLGFQERWLVVDVEPDDMSALAQLPVACQWCDPRRPTTHVQSGPRHRRWEFMLLPDEQPEEFDDRERVWKLLEPWYRPDDGLLTRHAVYEFRSMLADEMRADACSWSATPRISRRRSSARDCARGCATRRTSRGSSISFSAGSLRSALFDTVDPERQPQNEAIIGLAVELGKRALPARPAGGGRPRRDAAPGRCVAAARARAARPAGSLHRPADTDPLAGHARRPGASRRRRARGPCR